MSLQVCFRCHYLLTSIVAGVLLDLLGPLLRSLRVLFLCSLDRGFDVRRMSCYAGLYGLGFGLWWTGSKDEIWIGLLRHVSQSAGWVGWSVVTRSATIARLLGLKIKSILSDLICDLHQRIKENRGQAKGARLYFILG